MTHRPSGRPNWAAVAGLFLVGSLLCGPATGQYAIDYVIGPYQPEILDSWLFDINEHGQSTGYVDRILEGSYIKSAVKYVSGQTETLYSSTQFAGFATISGFAINNSGDVVGFIESEPHFFAADGTITRIEVADSYIGINYGLGPTGLNDSGDVLLTVFPFDLATIPSNYAGVGIWNQGSLQMLTALDELFPYVSPPDPNDFNSGPSSEHVSLSTTGLNGSKQFAADLVKFAFDPGNPEDFEDDLFTETYVGAYVFDGQAGYHLLEEPVPGAKISPIDIEESGAILAWIDDQQLGSGAPMAHWPRCCPTRAWLFAGQGRLAMPPPSRTISAKSWRSPRQATRCFTIRREGPGRTSPPRLPDWVPELSTRFRALTIAASLSGWPAHRRISMAGSATSSRVFPSQGITRRRQWLRW